MTATNIIRSSDGKTVRIEHEEAEHADIDAKAKRVILIDSSGAVVGSSGNFTQAIAYISGTSKQEYIGLAVPGTSKGITSWQIKKLVYSGDTITDVQWADGTAAFTKEWDERSTYSYS